MHLCTDWFSKCHIIYAENTTNKGKCTRQYKAEVATTNDKTNGSRPTYGAGDQRIVTLTEKKNYMYSFRRDKVANIFRDAMKDNLPLPKCKRPQDADKFDRPNFCPYHRVLGHSIEDCFVFKDVIETKYRDGEIALPESVLQNHASHAQANMVFHKTVASTCDIMEKYCPVTESIFKVDA